MIYLDGTALCRFLPGVRHGEAWEAWVVDHESELVTSPLGLTELRQAAALYPREQLADVTAIVERVRQLVPQVRFSDDNVTISSHATAVLKPFAALHIGAAVGADRVDQIATYDPSVAHVAEIYRLKVVTPGLEAGWYLTFEGPTDSWKPIALDAPYDPGAEFAVPALEPLIDPYAEALREVDALREVAALDALHDVGDEETAEGAEGNDEDLGSTDDALGSDSRAVEESGTEVAEEEPEIEPGAVVRELPPEPEPEVKPEAEPEPEPESEIVPEPQPELAAPLTLEPVSEMAPPPRAPASEVAPQATVERAEFPTPPRGEPEIAAPAVSEDSPVSESEASRRRAEMIARLGQYRPKVEAWHGGEAAAMAPADVAAKEARPPEPAPLVEPVMPAERVDREVPETSVRPRTPIESAVDSLAIPIGEPVRRPLLRQAPTPRSATEVPRPQVDEFPAIVPNFPLTVDIEDPTSYAPERFVASEAPLPGSHPFSRAGQTAAMEAGPLEPQQIPALEPIAVERTDARFETEEEYDASEPGSTPSGAEPAASGGRWRLGKSKDKAKGKDEKVREKRGKGSPAPAPDAAGPATDPGWKLEDILGPEGGRG